MVAAVPAARRARFAPAEELRPHALRPASIRRARPRAPGTAASGVGSARITRPGQARARPRRRQSERVRLERAVDPVEAVRKPGHHDLEALRVELSAAYPAVHRLSYIRKRLVFLDPNEGSYADATRFFPAALAR